MIIAQFLINLYLFPSVCSWGFHLYNDLKTNSPY